MTQHLVCSTNIARRPSSRKLFPALVLLAIITACTPPASETNRTPKDHPTAEAETVTEERARQCIADDLPRMENLVSSAKSAVDQDVSLATLKVKLDKVLNTSGKIEPSEENIKERVLTYGVPTRCESKFHFIVNVRADLNGRLLWYRVWAEVAPKGYVPGYHQELSKSFPRLKQSMLVGLPEAQVLSELAAESAAQILKNPALVTPHCDFNAQLGKPIVWSYDPDLHEGDEIVQVAGEDVSSGKTAFDLLASYAPGDSVDVSILRGGTRQTSRLKCIDSSASLVILADAFSHAEHGDWRKCAEGFETYKRRFPLSAGMERWAYACEVQANRARDKLADTLVLDVWKKSLTEAKWNKRVLDVLRADYYVKALQFVRRDEPLLARRLVALWDEAERFSPPVALPNIADQSVAWALDQRNVDAEYHGRYECPQGTTAFTILVRAASARADRDVVFRFGPDSENVYVSGGSFFMRGKVELEGGVLSLTPVSWISQPDSGWKMVGLEGASTDKGESFSGRVKGPGCKTFAISRAATRRLAQPEGLTH